MTSMRDFELLSDANDVVVEFNSERPLYYKACRGYESADFSVDLPGGFSSVRPDSGITQLRSRHEYHITAFL